MSNKTAYTLLSLIVTASLLSGCSQAPRDPGRAPVVSPTQPQPPAAVKPVPISQPTPTPVPAPTPAADVTPAPTDSLAHLFSLLAQPASSDNGTDFRIWELLTQLDSLQLQELTQRQSSQPALAGWLELLHLERQQTIDLPRLQQWEQRHPQHSARHSLLPLLRDTEKRQASIQRILVLLPDHPSLTSVNRDIENGIRKAHQTQPHNPHLQIIVLHDSLPAPQLMLKAQAYQPDWIIGPLTKSDIQALGNNTLPNQVLLNRLDTPTQALQLGLPIEDEADQLLDALSQDGRPLLVVASQDPQDQRLLTTLTQRAQTRELTLLTIPVDKNHADITPWLDTHGNLNASRDRILALGKALNRKLTAEPRIRQDIQALVLLGNLRQAQSLMPALHYRQIRWPVLATSRLLPTRKGETLSEPDLKGIQVLTPPYLTSSTQGPDTPFEALGWDSYQLLANPRLNQTGIQGMTGLLSRTPQNQVNRRLTWSTLPATSWPPPSP